MRQMMKIGVLMPAAVLLVSGCATKDWVREQFTKSDAVVDQRFVKVEGQVEGVSTEVKGVTVSASDNASTLYPIAALTHSTEQSIAQAFVAYVLSPTGEQVLKAAGFEQP